MSKLVLDDIGSGYNLPQVVNTNNQATEAALENTLSRDGITPNEMLASLDMNSNRVINLGSPINATDAARLTDVTALVNVTGIVAPSQVGNTDNALFTDGAGTLSWRDSQYFRRSATEIALGVVPVNFNQYYGVVDRYGTNTTPGTTNMAVAITTAVTVANASGGGKRVQFLPAVYATATTPEFGYTGLHVFCTGGRATIKYTGAGATCVSIDAGVGTVLYGHSFENIDIEGSGVANQDGLFIRNVVHRITKNIRVKNITNKGFNIVGDVLTNYSDCYVSDNEGVFTSIPNFGIFITGSALISSTTACEFSNIVVECANDTGIYLDKADGNRFNGGTSEGLVGTTGNIGLGIYSSVNSTGNLWSGFFCEANSTGGDLVDFGKRNEYVNCGMSSRAPGSPFESVKSIIIKTGAEQIRIRGGLFYWAVIETGALDTKFEFMDGVFIADTGTRSEVLHTRQLFNTATIVSGPVQVSFTPTFGGSSTNGTLTHDIQAGKYYIINGTCFFTLTVRASVVTGAPTGDLLVRGLPATSTTGFVQPVVVSSYNNITLPASRVQLGAEVQDGSATIRLPGLASGLAASLVQGSGLAANGTVTISGHYLIA